MDSDEPVVGNSEVTTLDDRVREQERMLDREMMEVEVFRQAFSKAKFRSGYCGDGRLPMKCFAVTLSVSRIHLIERLKGRSKSSSSNQKAEDAGLLPIIRRLVDRRPTNGYRRIAAPQ